MWVLYAIIWAVAGVAISAIGLAVSPSSAVRSRPLAMLLGLLGGLFGGLVIELLAAREEVLGITAGLIGSLMGASVLLILWTLVSRTPGERHA